MLLGAATAAVLLALPGTASATVTAPHGRVESVVRAPAVRSAAAAPYLTQANMFVTDLNTKVTSTYTGYPVTVDPGCGNSVSFVCLNMSGLGAFDTSPPAPLATGQTQDNPVMTISVKGVVCGMGQPAPAPYGSAIEVDQANITGSTVNDLAVQFACVNSHVAIDGTLAYRMTNSTPGQGYYIYGAGGEIANFGNDGYLNYLATPAYLNLAAPITGMATTSDGSGYWMAGSDGGIFSYGGAHFYGSAGNLRLVKPVVGMAATPDGKGYWMVASDGGIFAYGDAHFYGSAGNLHLVKPIMGMAATPDGKGYWMVASDGGIFNYGDAHFYGSAGNLHLVKPIVGMAPTADGRGYWFVASDGGIFNYGDAHFYGTASRLPLTSPIVGMAPTADGKGYWFVAADGGVFNYGDAHFSGSLGGNGVTDVLGIVR